MSEKIIKCAKCQNNAETEPSRNEFNVNYPIRDKDGKIYCWDCYKGFSGCQGCGKSVANLIFPKSGNPTYPHCSGYSSQCECVMNKVNFLCSKKCAESIAAKKYQEWKEKLSQGWTKCEECWKTWSEWEGGGMREWIKEEKNQWGFIKLVQPGQGKLCSEDKEWEEKGKQEYERRNEEYQKRWEALSNEEKLAEVKKEYRYGENVTEIATRSEIPPMVLRKWQEKDSHRQHNCPDCQLDREPTGKDNNFSSSTGDIGSEINEPQGKDDDNSKNRQKQGHRQLEKNSPENNSVGLIIGGAAVISFALFVTFLVIKGKKSKK